MCQSMFFTVHIIIMIMPMCIFRAPMIMFMLMRDDVSVGNSIVGMN